MCLDSKLILHADTSVNPNPSHQNRTILKRHVLLSNSVGHPRDVGLILTLTFLDPATLAGLLDTEQSSYL